MIKIGVTVNTKGLQRYRDNLNVLEQVVMFTAAAIEGEAKDLITTRSSRGNEYRRGDKIHFAAEPGNAPNSDSGRLVGSIRHKSIGPTAAQVSVEAEYAIPLSLLRFPSAATQTWGFCIRRDLARANEELDSVGNPRSSGASASRFGHLVGIEGLKPRQPLELVPYVATRSSLRRVD